MKITELGSSRMFSRPARNVLSLLAMGLFSIAIAHAIGQQAAPQKFTLAQIEGLVSQRTADGILSKQIHLHGLAFSPTPAIVDELRAKGAGPLTLATIQESFRKEPKRERLPNEPPMTMAGGDLLYVATDKGVLEVSPGESIIKRTAKTSSFRNDDLIWSSARREFYGSPRGAGGQEISVISRDSFTEIAKLKNDCTDTYAVRVSPDGRRLFLTCDNGISSSLRLIAFDLATRNQIATVPVNGYFISPLSPHGERLYLTGPRSNLAEYDADLKLLRQQSLPGFWPRAFSPDGLALFGEMQGKVVRISTSSLAIEKSLALPEPVSDLSLSTDGRYVFASSSTKIYRSPLTLDSYTQITPPHPAEGTFRFAESGDNRSLYVLGGYQEGIIWIIDEATSQVVKTISGINSAQAIICIPGKQAAPQTSGGVRPGHKMGSLEVHTEPGSQLFLDSKPTGIADSEGLLVLQQVPAGNHELVAQNLGYQEARTQFSIANNEAKQLDLALVWLGGYLSASVQPGAAIVTVSGAKTFQAGPSEIQCPAGTYTLTATLDGYASQTRTIQVVAGEHHKESFELTVDPAVLARKLDDARGALASGDAAGADRLAEAVFSQNPNSADAAKIVAEANYQLGDMNRFVDAGTRAIRGGKPITVRTMHAHTVMSLWIHPVDITITDAGVSFASTPPESRCKGTSSVAFELFSSARVIRDPNRGFVELKIQYASKPHGAILHDLDFVPEGSELVTSRQPGQIFGGISNIQEPPSGGQNLDGILRLILRAKR